MSEHIDHILESVRELSASIDRLAPDDPRREALITRRANLRAEANSLAAERRHPTSVANEIAMLEDRAREIETMKISKGYSEKHLKHTIQDPGAYSHNINRILAEEHQDELDEIAERLERLRRIEERTSEP